jgi:tyrosine-protein kinase Etk/Wzc
METRANENRSDLLSAAYRRAAGKRARMIAAVTAAAAVLACAVTFSLPDLYSAKAMILPVQEEKGLANAMLSQLGGLAGVAGVAAGNSNTPDLYVTMLKSETVRDPIIDRFDLVKATGSRYRAEVYTALDKSVAVAAGRKDGVVSITVEDPDPKRAAALANAYVEELQKLTVRLNSGGAGRNRSFFDERLVRAKKELALAEDNLKGFVARNKAVNLPEQTKATIEGVAKMKAQLALQEGELSALRGQFTERSIDVKNAAATVKNLRSQIARLEGTGGSSALPSVGSVPALGEEYARLMREMKLQEGMVELLTKQAEMARLAEAKDVAPVQVLQSARVPDRKSGPRRGYLITMSTVAVFLFSLIAALVAERFAATAGAGAEQERRRRLVVADEPEPDGVAER